MIDVTQLLFNVERDGVYLHFGPVGVKVCLSPHMFEKFKQNLVDQLEKIAKEIQEEYTTTE